MLRPRCGTWNCHSQYRTLAETTAKRSDTMVLPCLCSGLTCCLGFTLAAITKEEEKKEEDKKAKQ